MNSDNKACCAHLTVLYVTEPAGDDAVKGKWTCRECGHEFVPQARLDAAREDRRAPVQGYAAGIPWPLHLRAWDAYAAKWGSGQSAERLAERGGFAVEELDEFVPGWRDEVSELAHLRAELVEARRERDDAVNEAENVFDALKPELDAVRSQLSEVTAERDGALKALDVQRTVTAGAIAALSPTEEAERVAVPDVRYVVERPDGSFFGYDRHADVDEPMWVGLGDAFLCRFQTVTEAARWAVDGMRVRVLVNGSLV